VTVEDRTAGHRNGQFVQIAQTCGWLCGMSDDTFTGAVLRMWDFQDPAASQVRFADAAAAELDDERRQIYLTQVARAQALQKEYAAGHATLDALGDPADLADEPGTRALLERGRLHNSAGGGETAVPLFQAAYERAAAAGLSGLAVDAAHMLVIALPAERHEEWTARGLTLAEGSADPLARSLVVALHNNLGWTHADADRWSDALACFDRALAAAQDLGNPGKIHIAWWTRARALRALGRPAEALAILRELQATPEGADDPYVSEEIAANEATAR
jgi:tetratricopeptide (TPR) repeat protein